MSGLLPAITSILALTFALALLDQWRERRGGFQLVWAIGMLCYGLASGAEAIAASTGWNELLYRLWYLTGAVMTAGWLGLGTAFLLARTRFGYAFAFCLFLAGLFTFLVRNRPEYAATGPIPVLYFIAALILAIVVGLATYFGEDRWPRIAAVAVGGATLLAIGLVATVTLPAPGYLLDSATGMPLAGLFPGEIRLLTPFLNVTGAFSLVLGAVFSTYVFMPKRRVLAYSLDPNQTGDVFLFNLLIAPVAILVNFISSLPGAIRALATGQIHSRVPSTILIAIGAFIPSVTDSLNRFGTTDLFQVGKLLGVIFLFAGFLVSIEVFREIRIPFTSIRLGAARRERAGSRSCRGMTNRSSPLFGVAIVAIAAAMFGMLGPVTRFAYDDGLTALAFVAWRSIVGMFAAGGFVAWRLARAHGPVTRVSINRRAWLALLAACLGGFTVNIGMFAAFERIPVALVLLAFYTYPAMVAVVAVALRREPMDRWRAMALSLATLGMVAVVAGQMEGVGAIGFDLLGIGLALLAAVGQTVFVTVGRDGYRSIPTAEAITLILGFIGVAGAVAAVAVGTGNALALPLERPGLLGLLVFVGLFTAAIPSLLFLAGIRILGGTRVGILMLIEPVVGVLLAALLLSEALHPIQLAGGLAILAAAVLLERAPVRLPRRLRRGSGEIDNAETGIALAETRAP